MRLSEDADRRYRNEAKTDAGPASRIWLRNLPVSTSFALTGMLFKIHRFFDSAEMLTAEMEVTHATKARIIAFTRVRTAPGLTASVVWSIRPLVREFPLNRANTPIPIV